MKNGNPRKAELIKIETSVKASRQTVVAVFPWNAICSVLIPVSYRQMVVAVAETDQHPYLDCYQTSWAVAAVAVAAAAVAVDWCCPSMKAATVDCS